MLIWVAFILSFAWLLAVTVLHVGAAAIHLLVVGAMLALAVHFTRASRRVDWPVRHPHRRL